MQITLTKKLVAALVNGLDVPGLSYLQKVDRLAKVLGYANQAALMSALPKGPGEPEAPTAPETPRVVWPEPTFVPTKSGSDLNPDRVPFLYGAIKQELVIGEIMRLVEMLSEDIPGDEEDEMPKGILVTAGGTGQGKSTALAELLRNHMDARVVVVDEPREFVINPRQDLTGKIMAVGDNVRDVPSPQDERASQIIALEKRLSALTEQMELAEAYKVFFTTGTIFSDHEVRLMKKNVFFSNRLNDGTVDAVLIYEDLRWMAQQIANRLRFLDPANADYRGPQFPGDTGAQG